MEGITLRPVVRADLPALYRHQADPEANRVAVMRSREEAVFFDAWEKILVDTEVVTRAITERGQLLGVINRFRRDDLDWIGYWIDKDHWGRGVAKRAIALLLTEVTTRPLHARVAATNVASRRALLANGFVITEERFLPESERFPACDVAFFILA